MNSLIFLQGFALGGGAYPDLDRIAMMGWKALAVIGVGVVLYFLMKSLWPGEKW